jgi:hypothetical protein
MRVAPVLRFEWVPMCDKCDELDKKIEHYPDRWSWEILRKSKPLGIKMTGDGYQSEEVAAQFTGKRALADFLADVLKEEKRK